MPSTSIVELVAAELCDLLSLSDADRTLLLTATAHIAEMNAIGFDTNAGFDHNYLVPRVGNTQGFFGLTSLGKTGATYLVVPIKRVGDTYQAMVQVYNPGVSSDAFYRMTLVRANNGSMRMNAGWVTGQP